MGFSAAIGLVGNLAAASVASVKPALHERKTHTSEAKS